ncbi:EAL domain-containing protein [Marinobacter nauticus]
MPQRRPRTTSPLSFRLLAWVLLSSSAFTLLASGLQIHADYQNDLEQIQQRLERIEAGSASSLARSLWALDEQSIEIQLKGILGLPDIDHLRLKIAPDSELVMGELPRDGDTLTHSFPLVHESNKDLTLGELTITANVNRVYTELRRRVGFIIGTQFLTVFIVAIISLWIFRHLVTRHLTAMADYTRDLSLQNLSQPLTLDRPNRRDELGLVTEAINEMRERLNDDVARRERDATEILKLSKAIEQSPSSVLICDKQWQIEYANRKFGQLTGHKPTEILGRHPSTLINHDMNSHQARQFWQTIQLQVQRVGVWQGEINSVRRNGERYWEQLVITAIKDANGQINGYLILGEDISIRKRYEQQLLRQANYDILTGLPNRMLAMDRLKLALAQARRDKSEVGVMFLDLDNFKHINDTLGHDAGDTLLVEASRRVSSCLRGASTVARLGGDEFLVILPGVSDPNAPCQVAERILHTFATPFTLADQEVFVTTSIGIATFPTDSGDSGTLLRHADAAMYQAKHAGKSSYARFTPDMTEVSHERLQMESLMRKALEQGEFELFFQPIVDTNSGQVIAAEALLRWNNPVLGLVMPDRFIPLAEETGLILTIGEWVINEALLEAAHWRREIGIELQVAVNVSPRQFRDAGFLDKISRALEAANLPADTLELEVTERLILDNSIETADILQQLDQHGIRLSVDDFGTGYSALSYLKSYPFNTLKIDKSFVHDVLKETEDASLVRAIINMAHSLGLRVIAEGVEEEAQSHFLQTEGCDCSQGFFYGRPMSTQAFSHWLQTNGRANNYRSNV